MDFRFIVSLVYQVLVVVAIWYLFQQVKSEDIRIALYIMLLASTATNRGKG